MTKTTLGTERGPLSQQSPDRSPQMSFSRHAPVLWTVPGEAFLFSHKVRRGPNEQLSYYGSLPECVLQNAFVSLLPPPLVCSDSKSPGLLIFLSSTAGPRWDGEPEFITVSNNLQPPRSSEWQYLVWKRTGLYFTTNPLMDHQYDAWPLVNYTNYGKSLYFFF